MKKTGEIVFSKDEDGDLVPNVVGSGNTIKVGNSSPDFMLGWGNTFTYKGFSLYFLIDGRFGGDVLSQTQADMDQKGVSVESAAARNAEYVDLEGTHVNPQKFYTAVSGRNGCTEYYMYSATNIRLRELSLGYTFPKKLMEKTKVFRMHRYRLLVVTCSSSINRLLSIRMQSFQQATTTRVSMYLVCRLPEV